MNTPKGLFSNNYWQKIFFVGVYFYGMIGIYQAQNFNVQNIQKDLNVSVLGVPYSINPLGIVIYAIFGYLLIEKYGNRAFSFFFFSIGYTELQYNLVYWGYISGSIYTTINSPNWFFFLGLWSIMVIFGALVSKATISKHWFRLLDLSLFGIIIYLTFGGFLLQVVSGLLTLFYLFCGFEKTK